VGVPTIIKIDRDERGKTKRKRGNRYAMYTEVMYEDNVYEGE